MTRIIPAEVSHVEVIAEKMRLRDVAEVEAATGLDPEDALGGSLMSSAAAWSIVDSKGKPFCMFGVSQWTIMPDTGAPWCLATDDWNKHRKFILRNTKPHVEDMSRMFPILMNFVDVRNLDSIRWLSWAGFKFTACEPHFGPAPLPFLRFSKVSLCAP